MERTFKDRLAESLVPLVVALACAAAAWSAGPMTDPWHWGGLAATVAVAYAIHKVCSVNSVIPLRTWMTAAVLLLLAAMCTFAHRGDVTLGGALCYAVSLHFLFQSYQQYYAERWVFQAFLFLGLACLTLPPLYLLAPLYLLSMFVQLGSLTLRSLLAAMFGLFIPLEFYAGVLLLTGNTEPLLLLRQQLTAFAPTAIAEWPLQPAVSFLLVALLFSVAAIHYAYTNYNDKIRPRMFNYVLISQSALLLALLLLQPHHYVRLTPFILVAVSPVVARYFALGRGRWALFFFLLGTLLLMGATVFNLWSQSLNFL